MELGKYEKAKKYFNNSAKIRKNESYPREVEHLEKAEEELQLRMEGKYHDVLTELEQTQKN